MERHTRNEVPGEKHSIIVRLPVALHRELERRANQQKRSVNAHVTFLIEQDLTEKVAA